MIVEEKYMARCLQLARCGRGHTSPNPMVGAVIVHQERIIGEGYHRKCGEAHAEVNAIASVRDQSLLKESTLYVSLEPCMMGRGAIIQSRIANVYYAASDPKGGFCHSVIHVNEIRNLNHYPKLYEGYMKEDSAKLLKLFFKMKRLNKQP